MKNTLNFVLAILLTSISFGQINESAYSKMLDASITADQYFELYGISDEDLKNIVGSPYDVTRFQLGNIYKNDKIVAPNIPMRYNIFSDEIEINTSQVSQKENINNLSKSTDVFVSIANEVYVFIENIAKKEESGYFKVIVEGSHFDLYKKSSVTYIKKKFAETNYQQDQPARFNREDTFFLINKQGDFFEIPTKKKSFLTIFKQHNKEIHSFIKDNKLDIKNENHLAKIIKYFNTLI
tara:strand:+ start:4701 stop:5414 length:714 start_codon:yes stop_codon:yes gene_type:complete